MTNALRSVTTAFPRRRAAQRGRYTDRNGVLDRLSISSTAARPARRTGRRRSTSRICSIVLQSASSSAGAQTSTARHCAREVATLKRLAVEREADPARRVLGGRARHRDEDDRRLLPLELVDRADRDRLRAGASAASAPARCTARRRGRRSSRSGRVAPFSSVNGVPRSSSIAAAIASASSTDDWLRPSCSTGSQAGPLPAASERRAASAA